MKNKELLEGILCQINKLAHNPQMFPANYEYAVKGELKILSGIIDEEDAISVSYVNGNYSYHFAYMKIDSKFIYKEDYEDHLCGKLIQELLFFTLYGIGNVKNDRPLLEDLILYGEGWKEFVNERLSNKYFVKYDEQVKR